MKITEKDLTKLSTIRTKSYAKYFCIVESMKDIEDDKLSGGGEYQRTKADISVGRFSNLFQDDSEHTRH